MPPPSLPLLLELSASDDLPAFRRLVEDSCAAIDASDLWYGPSAASSPGGRRFGREQRTPLMIAALYGSLAVARYVLARSPGEAARASASDGATPLHLAASGGSPAAADVARLLLLSGASVDAVDAGGNRPGDLLPRLLHPATEAELRVMLKSPATSPESSPKKQQQELTKPEKKEYPPDLTLPDIKTGIFSTDEFRMYSFKVRPCSRAYSHDWTECPFAHPGENARRRDPRKFAYSCVPCPEFRKAGACRKGDACEYAHGVFESWLHPAQYRTRLCKDEVGCRRRICFFAHTPDELRTVNPSAISLSSSRSAMDVAAALLMMSPSSPSATPRMPQALSPSPAAHNRLKSALGANRELEIDLGQFTLYDTAANASSPRANWTAAAAAATTGHNSALTDYSMDVDRLLLSRLQGLQGLSPPESKVQPSQLLAGFDTTLPSSPVRATNPSLGLDNNSMAKAILNSRAAMFANRSQSFISRSSSPVAHAAAAARSPLTPQGVTNPSMLSDWGSPDGKLDWGVQNDELHKFRKSASFAYRSSQSVSPPAATAEPDLSWVNTLVKDVHEHGHGSGGGSSNGDLYTQWLEQEQTVA